MKSLSTFILFCLSYISFAQRIEITGKWKFIVDDNSSFSAQSFDDKLWKEIQPPGVSFTTSGYAWYRKDIVIPLNLKEPSLKYGYLTLALGCFDDIGQVFLNGEMIGQKGTFVPFQGAWGQLAEFLIPIEKIKWDKKNQISIRIYSPDTVGGGIHRGPFYMEPANRKLSDFLSISCKTDCKNNSLAGSFKVINTGNSDLKGRINYTITDKDKILLKGIINDIVIKRHQEENIAFNQKLPANDYYEIQYSFTDTLINQTINKGDFFNSRNELSILPTERKLITGYLIDDNIMTVAWNKNSSWAGKIQIASGWDMDTTGGNTFELTGANWLKLNNKNPIKGISMKKRFLKQKEGEVIVEFRLMLPKIVNKLAFQICNDTFPVLNLIVENQRLCFGKSGNSLQQLIPYREYGIKAILNLSTGKCTMSVNGKTKGTFDLLNNQKEINYVTIKTPKLETVEFFISPLRISKGYFVNESFLTAGNGSLPDDWNATNGAISQELFAQSKPDVYSLKMDDYSENEAVSFSKNIAQITQKTWLDYRFFSPKSAEGFNAIIGNDKNKITILIQNNQIGYLNEKEQFQSVHYYTPNLWHRIVLCMDPQTGLTDIWINDKIRKQQVQLPIIQQISKVAFSTGVKSKSLVWLDDIKLYAWQPEPKDYVPAPVVVKHDPYIIGMQSCSLWKEGEHFGWDVIREVENIRKPILGWYDEGLPETSDWQTKFLVEHGVDFNLYCWYQPRYCSGNPMKISRLDSDLKNGFFYSKYSHLLKFALMYENQNGGGFDGYDDFVNNIVPYWVEYYLKDPRYMVVDNKPIIAIYDPRKFEKDMGSLDDVKKGLAYLRAKCKEIGFADAILMCEYRSTIPEDIAYIKRLGYDYIYSYTWYTGNTGPQKETMDAQFKTGISMIPSPSMGWEPSAWKFHHGNPPSIASPIEFKQTLLWVKDTLMKKMPQNSLSSKMILLDNWNEFGEGHFIFPSSAFGFGYLDAIRSVFSVNPKHEDLFPTEEQKSRVNILYSRSYKE